jgi:hypothetical protein
MVRRISRGRIYLNIDGQQFQDPYFNVFNKIATLIRKENISIDINIIECPRHTKYEWNRMIYEQYI